MEYVVIIIVAISGAYFSFVSGFGLGTLLLPAFMIFFPAPVAIVTTAVVHMLNNIFKLGLVGRYADKQVLIYFGFTSVIGALLGAWLLSKIDTSNVITSYMLFSREFEITSIKLIMGILILIFTMLELNTRFQSMAIDKKWLPAGGLLSGFFGGLSGHQGALRSAFLMKVGLSKESFVGTRAVCAFLVDTSRIAVYVALIRESFGDINVRLVIVAALAAFAGAWFGNRWIKKTEIESVNKFISIALIIFSILLIAGII